MLTAAVASTRTKYPLRGYIRRSGKDGGSGSVSSEHSRRSCPPIGSVGGVSSSHSRFPPPNDDGAQEGALPPLLPPPQQQQSDVDADVDLLSKMAFGGGLSPSRTATTTNSSRSSPDFGSGSVSSEILRKSQQHASGNPFDEERNHNPLDGSRTESPDAIDDDYNDVRRFKTKKGTVWSNGTSWGAVGEESTQKQRMEGKTMGGGMASRQRSAGGGSGSQSFRARKQKEAATRRRVSMPNLSLPGKGKAKAKAKGERQSTWQDQDQEQRQDTKARRMPSMPSIKNIRGSSSGDRDQRRDKTPERSSSARRLRSSIAKVKGSKGSGSGNAGDADIDVNDFLC